MASRHKRKRKRYTTGQIRQAFAKLPPITTEADSGAAPQIVSAFKTSLRDIVMRGRYPADLTDTDKWSECCGDFTYQVLNGIPESIEEAYFKDNYLDPEFSWHSRRIKFVWRSLDAKSTPHGTIYFLKSRPSVRLDNGGTYYVAWSRHALDRIAERTSISGQRIDALAAVWREVLRNRCLEPATWRDQLGFWVWQPVAGDWSVGGWLLSSLTGNADSQASFDYQYRAGFCPVVLHGKFAVAKTLLFPSMVDSESDGDTVSLATLFEPWLNPEADASKSEEAWQQLRKLHARLPLIRPIPRKESAID